MNAEQIAALTAQITQTVVASMSGVAPAPVQDPEFEAKVQAKAAERQAKVDDKAKDYLQPLQDTFDDFSIFIHGRMLSQLARTARDGYFFARRMAEFQQTKVDGLREQRPAQGLEIDPLTDAETMLQTHMMSAEQNEVILAMVRMAWMKLDKRAAQELNDREQESFAKLVPNFDIGESAYAAFDQRQDQNYRKKQAQNRQGSIQATRTLARTESHGFI